jgi:hypothetical protein
MVQNTPDTTRAETEQQAQYDHRRRRISPRRFESFASHAGNDASCLPVPAAIARPWPCSLDDDQIDVEKHDPLAANNSRQPL